MTQWLAASDLAGLPGMPGTVQNVNTRARKEGWRSRERSGRGGGREYHEADLPVDTQYHLAQRCAAGRTGSEAGNAERNKTELATRLTESARERGLSDSVGLNEKALERADARLAVVRAFRRFHKNRGGAKLAARLAFVDAYNTSAIEIDPQLRAAFPRIAERTLMGWDLKLSREGVAPLAGRYGNRKGAGIIERDEELRRFVASMMVDHPHCSAKHVMRGLRARFNDRELPSYRTVQRFMRSWQDRNHEAFAAITDPDSWKNTYRAAAGDAAAGIVRLNQRWEMDSTPSDVMLADGRAAVVGAIDVYSRRLRLYVAPSSSSVAVAACLRGALLDWGAPEQLVTDNGKDYVSRHVTRVLSALDIEHIVAPPFSPERKPFIERAFGTFARDLQELCPGFIGHSVADRKSIESRRSFAERFMTRGGSVQIAMTAEAFQEFCDRWTDDVYGRDPHRGLGGASPFQRATDWSDPVRRIGNERALDILLAEAPQGGARTVQKSGIQVEGATYIAAELESYIREPVQVRFDPADCGHIYVFEVDGNFICRAECPERTGIDRREVAARMRERQASRINAARRELKAVARDVKTANIVGEILDERSAEASRITALPARSEAHDTAALDEASFAARSHLPRQAPELSPEERADANAKVIALTTPEPKPDLAARPAPQDPDHIFAAWIIEHPELATSDDREWLDAYMAEETGRMLVNMELRRRGIETKRATGS